MQENSIQTLATKFEEDTRDLLKKLGFLDVDGGTTFKIGGEQIDAIGAKDDVVLIVECKYRSKIEKNNNVRNHLTTIRGKIKNIEKGLKKDSIYSKYSKRKYILATKRFDIPKVNREYAGLNPKIYVMTDQDLGYYADLSRTIGEYARFDLFGELEVENTKDSIRVPAFKYKIEGRTVYSFAMNAKELLKSSYVARREQGNEEYYQRMVKPDRLESIKKYIDESKGFFPNNVILSINEKCSFFPAKNLILNDGRQQDLPLEEKGQLGVLQFPNKYRSCWIVDGQHRLYSFSKTKRDEIVFVVAFDNLSIEEQIKFFIDINDEQKPVDSDLLWDLQGQLRPESKEGKISNTAKLLNEKGALAYKIYIPLKGPRKNGMIKLSALCNALLRSRFQENKNFPSFPKRKNPFHSESPKKTIQISVKALNNYLNVVKTTFNNELNEEFWFTNSGVGILIYLYNKFLNRYGQIPSNSDLEKRLIHLDKFLRKNISKLDDYRTMLNSEGGRAHLTDQFVAIMAEGANDEKLMVGLSGLTPALEKEFTQVEDKLRDFINKILIKKYGKGWIKSTFKKDIVDRLEAAKKSKGLDDKREELYEFLTLGQIKSVILNDRWELFKKSFITENGFWSKQELEGAFDRISKTRNPTAHTSKYRVSPESEGIIRSYLKKISSSIT